MATGFSSINTIIRIKRDGRVLNAEDGVRSSGVRPNGDGTFQQRDHVEIPKSDQSKYSCEVIHESSGLHVEQLWGKRLALFTLPTRARARQDVGVGGTSSPCWCERHRGTREGTPFQGAPGKVHGGSGPGEPAEGLLASWLPQTRGPPPGSAGSSENLICSQLLLLLLKLEALVHMGPCPDLGSLGEQSTNLGLVDCFRATSSERPGNKKKGAHVGGFPSFLAGKSLKRGF